MNELVIAGLEPPAHASTTEEQETRREMWWQPRRRMPSSALEEFEALNDPEAPLHRIDSLA